MIGELIWDLLLTSPFLPRWKEASSAHEACGSCESIGFGSSGTSPGIVGASGSTGSFGTGGGPPSLSNPGRKIRDVTPTESMLFKNLIV